MNGFTKQELIREAVRREVNNSFWAYRRHMNPTMTVGWFQKDVAKHLQQFYNDLVEGKRPKLVIQAPPQHGKSVQILDFIAWLSGKNPNLKTIYASFSDQLGTKANRFLQRSFGSQRFRLAFPNLKLDGVCNNRFIEYSGFDGYFRNTTVEGSITGETLDLGVIDDPIKGREEADSETIRDKTWDWFTDDFFTRFSENAGFLAILTRWHVDDPIGRLLDRMDGIKLLSYPAIATEDEEFRNKGEALFPEHKSLEFLLERKKTLTEANFEALYQQHPVISDGNIFKPDEIQEIEALPSGYIRWVRGWDLASSLKGDYTVGAKIGKTEDGRFIIADIFRDRLGPEKRDAKLKSISSGDGRMCIISIPQDPGQAGKTQVLYLTKSLAGFRVKSSPETGDKVTRAQPFAAQVNVGNVYMLKGAWNEALKNEMRMFPNGQHDDQIDALSRAFSEHVSGNSGLNIAEL